MAYSFFPNDFQNLPNLQDQLFLIKQKQAAELNEYYAPSRDKETKPRDIAAEQEAIKKFMPSRPTGEESKPQPSLTSVRPAPSSPFKQPRPEGGFPKKEVIDWESIVLPTSSQSILG